MGLERNSPGKFLASFGGRRFDLIIERGLIEHLASQAAFFRDVNASLTAGIIFSFYSQWK
jgi:2-polyprenyl-3-methyl-5-hydroxy-6-metoxy-1,4-benzoquinol methylase